MQVVCSEEILFMISIMSILYSVSAWLICCFVQYRCPGLARECRCVFRGGVTLEGGEDIFCLGRAGHIALCVEVRIFDSVNHEYSERFHRITACVRCE